MIHPEIESLQNIAQHAHHLRSALEEHNTRFFALNATSLFDEINDLADQIEHQIVTLQSKEEEPS